MGIRRVCFVFFVMLQFSEYVQASFYDENPSGWVWYMDDVQNKHKNRIVTPDNARQYLVSMGRKMERYEAAAIINPTASNIDRVMHWRKKILILAKSYADAYQQYIWSHPKDDFNLQVAQRSDAIVAVSDDLTHDQDVALKELSRTFAIIYVFRGDCKFCKKFSPYLSRFQQQYGFNVIAYSLDGRPSPFFTSWVHDRYFLLRHGIHPVAVPAVYLVDPKKNKIITVGYGLMNLLDLKLRIMTLLKIPMKKGAMTLVDGT